MQIKRFLAAAGATAILMGSAVPAFATVNDADAYIKGNTATAYANTGGNAQDNLGYNYVKVSGGGNTAYLLLNGTRSLTTGDATATAKVGILANSNVNSDCGCVINDGESKVKWNSADASANTGLNTQDNYGNNTVKVKGGGNSATFDASGTRTLTTGVATAKAKTWIVVNSNVTWP